ncbi:hypothetical protein DEU56DRAFT_911188 [Suillus clintonianus]|uniref:uncharacterized protein n=1 Tax=Suillus clintonianus TaxID=1904413 RepID=UPI001B86740C|nr:uncharacterized protein DEU56DRAFT_911188 [Suillus clintonianus]KAG2141836.1 hypothetical protein DEU56DRAFT_911188 [Suillus clintonianus]
MIPGENTSTGGYDQDSGQQQITEAYRRPAPRPSPLFPGNHMLPQVDEFFSGGLQQDLGQQTPVPLMRGPQHETPYHGHNSHTPFTGSEPSSRSQSQAPSGSREGGYQQIYSFRQPQQGAPLRMDPYQHVPNTLEDQVRDLNATVARLVSEVARLTESNEHLLNISQQICLDNAQMSVAHEKLTGTHEALTSRVDEHDDALKSLAEKPAQKKAASKHVSNEHPALKRLIQPMFADLCGIESSLGRNKRADALTRVKPLESGEAYKTGEDDEAKTWHPNWIGHVDDEVNAKFIKEVIERVYDNERIRRENPALKNDIPDDDFDKETITLCTKDYFRNVHKQAVTRTDPSKIEKANHKKTSGRQRGRRVTVTRNRREAAVAFEKETGNLGAVAMIDTDYASDILTTRDLSEDSKVRRTMSGAGNAAKMAVGLQWRSPDYVAFLRFLTLRHMKKYDADEHEPAVNASTSRPTKRRKTTEGSTRTKVYVKKTFDISPSQMDEDAPLSAKNNLPFKNMVAKHWRKNHPEMKTLDGVPWLEGFWTALQDDDVIKEDYTYLQELEEWHLRQDNGGDESGGDESRGDESRGDEN